MKALTIRQPWASLIALGVKTIETRSWRAPQALIGQTLAVHAGKHKPPTSTRHGQIGSYRYDRYDDEWYIGPRAGGGTKIFLPLGAIVATATLADCVPMVAMSSSQARRLFNPHDDCDNTCVVLDGDRARIDHAGELRLTDVTDQLPYGDFAPGRWAWLLTNVQPTTNRCPACRGTGHIPADLARGEFWHCHICGDGVKVGYGRCQPIPTKGKQGVWTWQP